jgi:beta-lactam-binding protein with PASTA domain
MAAAVGLALALIALLLLVRGEERTYGAETTQVPDVRELSQRVAGQQVAAAGLVPRDAGTPGPNAYVAQVTPRAGTTVAVGSTVTLYLRTGPVP